MRRRWLALLLGLLPGLTLPCSGLADGGPQAKVFRITGAVVSSRDGSPVPYCRLTATAVQQAQDAPGRDGAGRGGNGREENASDGPGAGPGGQFGGDVGGGFDVQMLGRGGGQGRPRRVAEAANETVADAQGHFSLTVPHAGPWRLSGMARGYRGQNYDAHEGGFYSQVVLTDAAPMHALTFRMEREGVISGVVYDEAGEPVRQAQVRADAVPETVQGQWRAAAAMAGVASTDDRGHYEMAGLAPGRYKVRVSAQPWYALGMRGSQGGNQNANQTDIGAALDPSLDLVYATTWYPGVDNEDTAEPIALAGGDERSADFHLNAVSSIHLRVPRPATVAATAANQPGGRQRPQGGGVTLSRVSMDGSPTMVMQMNGNGGGADWDFGGLTPGIYEVRMPGPDGQPGGGEVEQIEVQGGSRVVTLDAARPLTRVTIKVEGLPEGMFPFVEFVDLETGRRVTAQEGRGGRGGGGRGRRGDEEDANGDQDRELTASLPPHRYAVSVGGNGGIYLKGIAATDAQVLGHTIAIGGGTPALTLTVATGRAEIAGVVKTDAGPIEGVMVLLVPISLGQPGDVSAVARAQSNTDGSFAFHAIEPGRYILVAVENGWGVRWTNPQTLASLLGHGVPMELKAGARATEEIGAVMP